MSLKQAVISVMDPVRDTDRRGKTSCVSVSVCIDLKYFRLVIGTSV